MTEATMAKRKTAAKKPPVPTSVKSVAFRVSAEYAEWVEQLAAYNRTSISALMDQALASFASEKGFATPPPERT